MTEELKKCGCCGCMVSYVRGSNWHGGDRLCRPCFFIWYDDGLTNREAIKALRLKRHGTGDVHGAAS